MQSNFEPQAMRGVAGVYCIRNIKNGKVYIGSSVNIGGRWRWHRSSLGLGRHHSILLQRAWGKYGPESFVFELIERETDESIRLTKETCRIEEARSANPKFGYNLAPVGGTCLGYKHSEETRAKCAARKVSEETREKHRINNTGRKHSAETRAKMSANSPRLSPSAEQRAAIGAVHKGKTISEAHRAISAQTCRERNKTPEHRAKVSAAKKGSVASAETRALLSAAHKGKTISEDHKERIRAKLKGRTFTAEHLAKIKASLQANAARKRAAKLGDVVQAQHVAVDRQPADLAEVGVVRDHLVVAP